jgi:hypothetical protein
LFLEILAKTAARQERWPMIFTIALARAGWIVRVFQPFSKVTVAGGFFCRQLVTI